MEWFYCSGPTLWQRLQWWVSSKSSWVFSGRCQAVVKCQHVVGQPRGVVHPRHQPARHGRPCRHRPLPKWATSPSSTCSTVLLGRAQARVSAKLWRAWADFCQSRRDRQPLEARYQSWAAGVPSISATSSLCGKLCPRKGGGRLDNGVFGPTARILFFGQQQYSIWRGGPVQGCRIYRDDRPGALHQSNWGISRGGWLEYYVPCLIELFLIGRPPSPEQSCCLQRGAQFKLEKEGCKMKISARFSKIEIPGCKEQGVVRGLLWQILRLPLQCPGCLIVSQCHSMSRLSHSVTMSLNVQVVT